MKLPPPPGGDGPPDSRPPVPPSPLVDAVARVRCTWDADRTRCRAVAYDASDRALGEVTVELPDFVRTRIWASRGAVAQFRMEEIVERHLRAMLELRF